jgi:PleD family two-component response regulator
VARWDGEEPPERLLERADDALYRDKKSAPSSEALL